MIHASNEVIQWIQDDIGAQGDIADIICRYLKGEIQLTSMAHELAVLCQNVQQYLDDNQPDAMDARREHEDNNRDGTKNSQASQ